MNMYDIINGRGNAAQKIAFMRMRLIIRRAITAARFRNYECMLDHISELDTFICGYNIGIYSMYGNTDSSIQVTEADKLTIPQAEHDKITNCIYKFYEMEIKRK